MRRIYVFGNSLVEKDSLALKVAETLDGKVKGFEFVPVQSLDEAENIGPLWVLDVAEGIEKVQLIEGLEMIETGRPVSGHDFDLAMELKLLHKLGKLGNAKIIAIPAGYELKKAEKEAKKLLAELSKHR